MAVEGLESYSKDELIEELINRQTFVGLVVYMRGDAKAGRLDPGDIVMTTSPPLGRLDAEILLQAGQSMVPGMFGESANAGGTANNGLSIQVEFPPLRVDEGGAVRVGNGRITLDLIVKEYESGKTPEDMIRAYDSLQLAEVYSAISYYLRNRDQVEAYLQRRAGEAEALRAKIEAERPRLTREQLMAHRASETGHASTGQ